jgi:hypothetical protein
VLGGVPGWPDSQPRHREPVAGCPCWADSTKQIGRIIAWRPVDVPRWNDELLEHCGQGFDRSGVEILVEIIKALRLRLRTVGHQYRSQSHVSLMNIGNKVSTPPIGSPADWARPAQPFPNAGPRYAPHQTSILGHVAATGREMPANGNGFVAGPRGVLEGAGSPRAARQIPFRHSSKLHSLFALQLLIPVSAGIKSNQCQ